MRGQRTAILAIALTTVASVLPSNARATDETKRSVFSTRVSDYGGFLGMDFRFGDVGDEFAAFVGGEAALLVKHQFYIGIRGAGLTTNNVSNPEAGSAANEVIGMGYGGTVVGYVVPTRSIADFGLDVFVGGGAIGDRDSDREEDWDPVFVFEPSLSVEVKLARMVRLGFGAGYRFVGDVDTPSFSDSDFRGMTGLVRVRVGWF